MQKYTLDELNRFEFLAKQANRGKWRRGIANQCRWVMDFYDNIICETGINNADYIATFDPPTILRFINLLRETIKNDENK